MRASWLTRGLILCTVVSRTIMYWLKACMLQCVERCGLHDCYAWFSRHVTLTQCNSALTQDLYAAVLRFSWRMRASFRAPWRLYGTLHHWSRWRQTQSCKPSLTCDMFPLSWSAMQSSRTPVQMAEHSCKLTQSKPYCNTETPWALLHCHCRRPKYVTNI